MVISVCVGSSCHLKGSYDVIQKLTKKIEENNLKDKIEIKASFCLGNCMNGVSMKIDDELVSNASSETIDEIFNTQILPKI